jgi:hypothetical protein
MVAEICQTERWSFQNRGVDRYLAALPTAADV